MDIAVQCTRDTAYGMSVTTPNASLIMMNGTNKLPYHLCTQDAVDNTLCTSDDVGTDWDLAGLTGAGFGQPVQDYTIYGLVNYAGVADAAAGTYSQTLTVETRFP